MSTSGGWATPGQEQPGSSTTPAHGPTGPAPAGPPPDWQGRPSHTPSAGGPPPGGQGPAPHTPPAVGPPPGWQGRPVYQPGVIPFRPLSLGDLYSAAFAIIRGNPASTVGVALILSLIALIPTTPLGVWFTQQSTTDLFDPTVTPDAGSGADFVLMMSGQLVPTMAASFAILALAAFIAYVTGQAVLGRKVKLPETWRGTRSHVLRVLGASLLIGMILLVVTAVLLAPGVAAIIIGAGQDGSSLVAIGLVLVLVLGLLLVAAYLFIWTRLGFVGPAIVLEQQSVVGALRRSWQLTRVRGGFWRILGIRILTMLLVWIVAQILSTPLAFVGMGVMVLTGLNPETLMVMQVIITSITTLIVSSLTTPVSATVDTLLYVDQRIRNEALDVQLMQAADGQAALPWLPATDLLGADRS